VNINVAYGSLPFSWRADYWKFIASWEEDEPENMVVDKTSRLEYYFFEPIPDYPFIDTEEKFWAMAEPDDPCDRCGKSCGNDVHEALDGYICESCFMDDVTRAEYMSEGDR